MTTLYITPITVEFDEEPQFVRKPPCPQRFTWQKTVFHIEEMLSEWRTVSRLSSTQTYVGLARIYYRVRVAGGRIFEIYYDPRKRPGQWILAAEVSEPSA